ncbi:MAG TPA: hypothetical protein ENO30_03770 [Thermodesulfobium narugense]|nr:hypothetical protein [Thermodesulfobium narugense]
MQSITINPEYVSAHVDFIVRYHDLIRPFFETELVIIAVHTHHITVRWTSVVFLQESLHYLLSI